jgi:hypothetical protein
MNRHACLMTLVSGAALLCADGAAAAGAADNISDLLTKIGSTSVTPTQESYSRELKKSVNAAAVLSVARSCAKQRGAAEPATFTLVGMVRIDGALSSPVPMPDTAFGACVAGGIGASHFPLPPGDGHGWPVAMQFDAKTGKVIYVAGDKQSGVPRFTSTIQWLHTPLPAAPPDLRRRCTASIWLSLDKDDRATSAELGDSECPAAFNAALVDATRQWLGTSRQKAATGEAKDVRVSFVVSADGIRVTF